MVLQEGKKQKVGVPQPRKRTNTERFWGKTNKQIAPVTRSIAAVTRSVDMQTLNARKLS